MAVVTTMAGEVSAPPVVVVVVIVAARRSRLLIRHSEATLRNSLALKRFANLALRSFARLCRFGPPHLRSSWKRRGI